MIRYYMLTKLLDLTTHHCPTCDITWKGWYSSQKSFISNIKQFINPAIIFDKLCWVNSTDQVWLTYSLISKSCWWRPYETIHSRAFLKERYFGGNRYWMLGCRVIFVKRQHLFQLWLGIRYLSGHYIRLGWQARPMYIYIYSWLGQWELLGQSICCGRPQSILHAINHCFRDIFGRFLNSVIGTSIGNDIVARQRMNRLLEIVIFGQITACRLFGLK